MRSDGMCITVFAAQVQQTLSITPDMVTDEILSLVGASPWKTCHRIVETKEVLRPARLRDKRDLFVANGHALGERPFPVWRPIYGQTWHVFCPNTNTSPNSPLPLTLRTDAGTVS